MLKLVIVAALVAATGADSASDPYNRIVSRSRPSQQCAGYCKDSSKFSLRSGSTYVYSYEGTTTSKVSGTSNETSEIRITAKAHVQVTAVPCELILQVHEVELFDSGSDGLESAARQREFAVALEENPLRFSFQDGRVEQLCPSADEPTWVLNLKRGLLSVFQNSMVDFSTDAHLYERDVSGTCETTYSVQPLMWSDVKVLRRKNLHSCSNRKHQTLGLHGTLSLNTKSIPIIKSEQICEQTIKVEGGPYLSNAKCQESHVFAPFSSGQSGITTSTALSLSLDNIIETAESIITDLFVNKRTNLQFDFSPSIHDATVTEESVWNTLELLVSHSQEGVGRKVPHLFDQLVRQLGALDDQQLVKLFDQQHVKEARKLLLDALPLVGSDGSVRAMYQIYTVQEMSRDELDSWLTVLAFHKQPTLDMLHTLNLFIQEGFHPKAWLAVSSVVHSYCQQDPACVETPEVQAIMSRVESTLGNSCHSTTREQQQAVVVALKAIGNIGFTSSLETLKQCFENEFNPIEVRLAAISATRRFSCSKLQQLPMLQMFQNRGEDAELRIAAYLADMQCPTTASVSRLRDSLYSEDTNQVLSFVWTHLTNLQETTSSWKKEIRQMLQDSYLANKFKTDARKFSRNYEMSFYSDILSMGATVDSNVVFSSKSYLPRSATLNLTLDLFGEAVNIFEVGTRVEGFESVVEDIFSPKGYFPDKSMQKMLQNMRGKDDEKNEVIQSFSEKFTKGTKQEPEGTMFARVFGNELYLMQFTGLNNILDPTSKTFSIKNLMDSLSTIFKNSNIDNTKSFRFVNTQYVIPTVSGLPLRLEINGTATVGIKFNTEMDLSSILKTKSGNVALSLNPSAAMQVDGKMMVDAVFAHSGVEIKGSVYSNTYLDTKITLDKGQIIDMTLNVPRDKVELINVSSAVYLKHRDELVEVEGVGEVSEHDSCSGDHEPTISGMRACSQYTVRNASAVEDSPHFPLTGRFRYALALHKSDDFSSYQLHLKQLFEATHEKYSGKFTAEFDTPGSKLNRKLLADLSFNTKSGDANLELSSPMGSFLFTGKLGLSAAEKSLNLRALVNGEEYAAIKMALLAENTARTIRYEPSFVLQAYPNINLNVTGRLNIVPGTKYSADVTAVGFTRRPLTFSGDISGTKGRYVTSLSAKAEAVDIKVNGRLVNTPTLTSCKTMVRYVFGRNSMQSVDFSAKLQNHKKGGFTKKQLWINLQMSELPEYSTKVAWILYRTQKYFDSNVDLTLGKTQWKSQLLYHNSMQERDKTFEISLSLESPTKNLDYRAEVEYKTSKETVHGHILAQLSKKNQFISRLDYNHTFPRHALELELASPWKRAYLGGRLESPVASNPEWTQTYNSTVILQWGDIGNPRWVSASGMYMSAETALSTRQALMGKLDGQGWGEPLLLEGEWTARSSEGMIFSDSVLAVFFKQSSYKMAVGYVKDPAQGKHDLKLDLTLHDNQYSGNFLLINNQEIKNVTIRMDLEKSLYFTSQVRLWTAFDLQLFWNYLEDREDSVLMQYRNSPKSEVAIVSMPGHYASLTVDKLGPGYSSMNITAMWGESEGSANNAILLSTYWLFDTSSWYVLLPVVQTRVHLSTPFVGFEQQSFFFNMNGAISPSTALVTRDVNVSVKWQNQFIDFEFNKKSSAVESDQSKVPSMYKARISSSLEIVKDVNLQIHHERKMVNDDSISTLEKKCNLGATYNKWAEFVFNSTYTPTRLSIGFTLDQKADNKVLLSGELSVSENSILVRSTLPINKSILFTSKYNWPNDFFANLTTPFQGYEESNVQYNIQIDDRMLSTIFSGKLGKDFLLLSSNLGKSQSGFQGELNISSSSQSGFQGELNISSSSSVPDVTVILEHEILRNRQESSFKEFASVMLHKKGEVVQRGQLIVAFAEEASSSSLKIKKLQTVLQLPGHYSSSNYTYQTQIKLTGIETQHYLSNLWNKDKTELSFTYEGFSFINALLKRNNDKKAELLFKNSGSGNYRTDLTLPGGYFVRHRLLFLEYTNWENFLMISSPIRKVIIKNLQSLNAEKTDFAHKSTVSLDKEVAFLDALVKLDSRTSVIESILFSTTTPWNFPVMAKYDLLINTGVTMKHEIQLKFKQDQEIKVEFDTTSADSKHSSSFKVYSPYCKQLSGELSFEAHENFSKGNAHFKMDDQHLTTNIELIQTFKNPSFSMNVNTSKENIINVFCNYNIENTLKEARFTASFFRQNVSFQGHYYIEDDSFKAGLMANTPISGLEQFSVDLDSILSHEDLSFVLKVVKNYEYITISGNSIFKSDLFQNSLSVSYLLTKEVNKYSIVLEYSKGRENVFAYLSCKNNESNVIHCNIQLDKELDASGHVSYILTYNAHTPLDKFRDSSFSVKIMYDDKMQKISGRTVVNDWETTLKGENTIDVSGTGHLDLKITALENKVGLYVKHAADEKDAYSWLFESNDDFVRGSLIISKTDNGIQMQYGVESSAAAIQNVNGIMVVGTTAKLFALESLSNVNSNSYILNYNVSFFDDFNLKTKHTLWILLPLEGFKNIKGVLEYERKNSQLSSLKGEIDDGRSRSKISYFSENESPDDWSLAIDLPSVFNLSVQKTVLSFDLSAKTTPSQTIPKFSLTFNVNKTVMMFDTNNIFTGKVQLTATVNEGARKLSVSGVINDFRADANIKSDKQTLSIKFVSNIPKWNELSIIFTHRKIDEMNENYSVSISKDREEMLGSSLEGFYYKNKGDGVITLTLPNFFMDISLRYELSSNFSAWVQYNINGNKQKAQGRISFLPDSARIDLATPIRGLEDVTLIGNIQKKDKKAGLVFQRNGKVMEIELSATLESTLILLKGSVVNGEDEFFLTLGAQNGTAEEPHMATFYINASKNKLSIFSLSLEGSCDLEKKAGVKMLFSSFYHNQLFLEIFSLKEESKRMAWFNYLHGIDIIYSLNTTILGTMLKQELYLSSQFGQHKNDFKMKYNILQHEKFAVLNFKINDDKFLDIHLTGDFSVLVSNFKFVMKNKDLIYGLDSSTIEGKYSFKNDSKISLSYLMNNISYFDLFMEFQSLYNMEFRSFLLSSDYVNTSYDVSLAYALTPSLASINSYVNMNDEFYNCKTNLTWKEGLAETFFQIITNGGYGFENATLTAQYSAQNQLKYYHFIDFTVDDSTLFHISSDILYPNKLFIDLVLPDSLFLPFVKEVSFGFGFTEDEQRISFKYMSGSNEKRKINLLALVKENLCLVDLGRSERNEGVSQSDDFLFTCYTTQDTTDFQTSLSWESNNIFTTSYHRKQSPSATGLTLSELLFNMKQSHSWNISAAYGGTFGFAGILSPTDMYFNVKHPTTVYHHQVGLSELVFTRAYNGEERLRVYYKNDQHAELEFKHTGLVRNIINLVEKNEEYNLTSNLIVSLFDNVIHGRDEERCDLLADYGVNKICLKSQYEVNVTGLSQELLTLLYKLEYGQHEISGTISTATQKFDFGLGVRRDDHRPEIYCSSVNFFLNPSLEPKQPFSVNYESNCWNYGLVSLNLFNEEAHSVSALLDYDGHKPTGFKLQGRYLHFEDWTVTGSFLSDLKSLKINVDKDFAHIQLQHKEDNRSLLVESSNKMMKQFEFSIQKDLNKMYFGKYKFEGDQVFSEWSYDVSHGEDGMILVNMNSNSGTELNVVLGENGQKQFYVKLVRNGKVVEGEGSIFWDSLEKSKLSGSAQFSIDGQNYDLKFERFLTFQQDKHEFIVKTPKDIYFADISMNKVADFGSPFISVRYKTPFYPFDFADLKVRYAQAMINSEEGFSLEEIEQADKKEERYNVTYNHVRIGFSLKTNIVDVEDVMIILKHGGGMYSAMLSHMSKQVVISASSFENDYSSAFQGLIDVQGVHIFSSQMDRKTELKIYWNKMNVIAFASFQMHTPEKLISTFKCVDEFRYFRMGESISDDNSRINYENNCSAEIIYDGKTILKLDAHHNNNGIYEGHLYGQWKDKNRLAFNFSVQNDDFKLDMIVQNVDKTLLDTQFFINKVNLKTSQTISLDLVVNKFLSVDSFKPKFLLKHEIMEGHIAKYQVNFSSGFMNEELNFNGSCSVMVPGLETFSVKSVNSVHADILFESSSTQYAAMSDILLQHKKMDASVKWRRLEKLATHAQDLDFAHLECGGSIQNNSAELYLNENKLLGYFNKSNTQTSTSIFLFNEKLGKNITVLANVQYSPVFLLNISHNVFHSPCSVEVKVDRQPQSLESAVTIAYNSLKQQAFVNVYMDSNPRYVELIYIDIWQQTHEASAHVEDKNDEVTLRGKINSPAVDENFLIATLGNNNDKFDLNLNDVFIVKVFKDDSSGLLDLLVFGSDYRLKYSCEQNFEISLESPKVNGFVRSNWRKIAENPFVEIVFNADIYNFTLEVYKTNMFNIRLKRETENIFQTTMEIEQTKEVFRLQFLCDVFDQLNSFSIKHTNSPVLLVISLNSSPFLKKNLEIVFGMKNEDLITGVFEIKQEIYLLKSNIALSKENRTLEMTVEAPFFSEMDKAKVSGIFSIMDTGECDMKLAAALSSPDTLLAQASIHFVKNDKAFSSGLIVKSKLKSFEEITVTLDLPLQISRDMRANFVVQLPSSTPCEVGFTLCVSDGSTVVAAVVRLQDFLTSLEYKHGDTPFYSDLYELNLQYLKTKLQIGAWLKPKAPLTDYIYFLDTNNRRIIEVSHALVLQQNHFKTKFILESAFKDHEKYGIDLELKNLEIGKVVRLLGSAPQIGKDLGIDFEYNYANLLNWDVLAQIRIPLENQIKTARFYSLHNIHPDLNFSKLNYSLEYTDLGIVSWELEIYRSAPVIWQGGLSSIESKLNLNKNLYSMKAKSFVQPKKIQVSLYLESPFENLRKGEIYLSGTQQLVGSELMLSINSNELVNINITEVTNVKQITILSKWKSVILRYSYNIDDQITVNGYLCWDLLDKNASQLGLSLSAGTDNQKYETAVEFILPSVLVPKLSVKTAFEKNTNDAFYLVEIDCPGLVLEGKLANEVSPNMLKTGLQLKWAVEENTPKNIGVFYVTEETEEEAKYYFTLQHFALTNDLMLTVYTKNTLYGVNLQYSPVKEEEITMEFGYWFVEDGIKERSGMKLVALHPATNTLIYCVANITASTESTEAGVSVAYLTESDSSKVKYVEVYGKNNKKMPEVFVGLRSNGNSLVVGGSVWEKENALRGMTLETRVNQKDPFKMEVVQNFADPGVEVELSYSLSRTYRLFAGMPNDNELTARLSHSVYGKPNLDALASLRLNTSRTLWGRFELPPIAQVGQEFYNGIVEEYTDLLLVSEAISYDFTNFLHEDFAEKVFLLLNAISKEADVLISQTSFEMEAIKEGFNGLRKIIERIYHEDHFYMRTIHDHLKRAGSKMYGYTSCIVQVIANVTNSLFSPVLDVVVRVWDVVQSVLCQWKMFIKEMGIAGSSPIKQLSRAVGNYQSLRHSVIQYTKEAIAHTRTLLTQLEERSAYLLTQAELQVNRAVRSVEQVVVQQLQRLIDYKDTVLAGFSVLGDTIERMLDIVTDGVYRIREVRYTLDWAVKLVEYVNSWYRNFHLDVYLTHLDAFFTKVMKMIQSDIEKNFGEYEVYLLRAKYVLEGQFMELNNIPQIHHFKNVANNVYQKVKWFWNYAELSERLRDMVKKYVENMKATLDELEDQLDREEGELKSEYSYSVENNSLTFTQELPFEWRAFNQLPEYNVDMSSRQLSFPAQEYSNMVHTMANYLWQDAKLLPYLMPPFGADALLSGDSFITFDNIFYHFSGDCNSYLLASDLYHSTFSLIVNFDQQGKKDIHLISQDLEIVLKKNLEIFVNGKLEDLPLKLNTVKPLTLERTVYGVLIKSEEGFSLECSSFQDLCKFHLDGWYMGKTAGLFGTYNNEPSDDFVDPNRQPCENIKEFTDSWAVDSRSCEKEDESSSTSEDVMPYESMCELFFSSQSSPFFPCFHVVNPKAFFDMCMAKAKQDNTCSSVLAYLTKCTSAGVQLWMPEFCVDSSITEGTLLTGYSDIIEVPSKMAADVVFLMEEAECVTNDQLDFATIMTSLSTDLSTKGLTENQFALISFGSRDARIQTINGQIWTQDEKLLTKAISRLEDTDDSSSLYNSALDLAANLPFRPGASKVIILIHCSSCTHNENYGSVLERFSQNDITLHILQKENIMGKKGKIVSKAIGLEKSGAYPRKRLSKNILPNPQLLQQVSVPQDLCTPIMISTNGTLFNLDVTKKSVRAWSGRVAQGAVPATDWKQCENSVGSHNIPVWRCRRTSSNTKLKDWDQTILDEYMDTSRGADLYTEYEEVDR